MTTLTLPETPTLAHKPVVLAVHGFGSSAACWEPLLKLLREDEGVASRFDFECFQYDTRWFNFNPLQRIPTLREIGMQLGEFIDSPRFHGAELTLVGHSQGGLVIQSYIAELLRENRAERLAPIRQVVLFATPNLGSTTAAGLRRLVYKFLSNPQERSLRVLDTEIALIRSAVVERIVNAAARSAREWPLPVTAFFGLRDKVVPEASARGDFDCVAPLDGDHFQILRPADRRDPRYQELVERLLLPRGHRFVWEVERFEQSIRVEPLGGVKRFELRTKSGKPRAVECDNRAKIERSVTFSRGNRCDRIFPIRYRTRDDGFLEAFTSHPNEATAAERGAYEEEAKQAVFGVTPRPGETFRLKLDVYKGFDAGNRNLHSHLGRESYYHELVYTVDLSAYLAAGWKLRPQPELFVHPGDPGHGELCSLRGGGRPVAPTSVDPSGIWSWKLRNVQEGIVDIVWDFEGEGPSAP